MSVFVREDPSMVSKSNQFMDSLDLIEYTPSFLKEINNEIDNTEVTHLTGFEELEQSLKKTLEDDTLVFDI